MAFQWKNFTMQGPANSSGSTSVTNITSSATSDVLNEGVTGGGMNSFVWTGTVDVNTPQAAVSASGSQVTNSGGDILFTNSTQNNFALGLAVQFTTETTLPSGITAATSYYVIPVTSSTYKVATTLANALAGTAVDYTNTGTGNQTATPVAISGSFYLEGSNDNETTWAVVPNTSQTLSADGSFVCEVDYIRYSSYRSVVTLTSGQLQVTANQIGYKTGA